MRKVAGILLSGLRKGWQDGTLARGSIALD